MSKIANAFKDGKAFIGFLTAGDPTIEKTVEYILAMEEAGCDLIEIGIPFSDPMAEGVVIQDANIRALGHNTTTDDVFEIVRKVLFESAEVLNVTSHVKLCNPCCLLFVMLFNGSHKLLMIMDYIVGLVAFDA